MAQCRVSPVTVEQEFTLEQSRGCFVSIDLFIKQWFALSAFAFADTSCNSKLRSFTEISFGLPTAAPPLPPQKKNTDLH